jgi:hypothetical protein
VLWTNTQLKGRANIPAGYSGVNRFLSFLPSRNPRANERRMVLPPEPCGNRFRDDFAVDPVALPLYAA